MATLKYSKKNAIEFIRELEELVLNRVQNLPVVQGKLQTHPKLAKAAALGEELGLGPEVKKQLANILGPASLTLANKVVRSASKAMATQKSRAALSTAVRSIFKNQEASALKKYEPPPIPKLKTTGSNPLIFGSLNDIIQNTSRTLEGAKLDYSKALNKDLRAMENKIMSEIAAKGTIDDAVAQSIKIHAELNSIYKENFMATNRRQVQRGYRIAMNSVKEEFSSMGIPLAFGKTDTALINQLFGSTMDGLESLSLKYLDDVSTAIRTGIISGTKDTAIMTNVRKLLSGGVDGAGNSLASHSRVLVHDGIMGAQRRLTVKKAREAKMRYFMWAGSVIASSRPMCSSNSGRVFTEFELNEMDLYAWQGKSGSVWTSLGGFHCRHHLVPVSDTMAGKIRDEFGDVFPFQNYYANKGKAIPPSGKTKLNPNTYQDNLRSLFNFGKTLLEIPGVKEGLESYALYYGKGLWNKIDFAKLTRNRRKKAWRKDVGKAAYDAIAPLVPQEFWLKSFNVSEYVTPYVNRITATAESALSFAQYEVDALTSILVDLRKTVDYYHPLIGDAYPKARDAWTLVRSNRVKLSTVRASIRDLQKRNASVRKKVNKGVSASKTADKILEAVKKHYPDLDEYNELVKAHKPALDNFLKTTRKGSLAASKVLTASNKVLTEIYKDWTKVINVVELPYSPIKFLENQIVKVENALEKATQAVAGFKKDANDLHAYLRKMAYPIDESLASQTHREFDLHLDKIAGEYYYNVTKATADEVFTGLDEAFMKMKRVSVVEVPPSAVKQLPDVPTSPVKLTTANKEALDAAAGGHKIPNNILSDLKAWGISVDEFESLGDRIIESSSVGMRFSVKDGDGLAKHLIRDGEFKNIYQLSPDSLYARKGVLRDQWEDNLSGGAYGKSKRYKSLDDKSTLSPGLADERPIYGFLFGGGKTKSASAHGEVIAEFKDDVSKSSSLSVTDSSYLTPTSAAEWGKLGTFADPAPVHSRLHSFLKNNPGDEAGSLKSLLKKDPQEAINDLVGNGYVEAQVHSSGALDLSTVKKLWIDKDALEQFTLNKKEFKKAVSEAQKNVKLLSEKYEIPWGYLGETKEYLPSTSPFKDAVGGIVKDFKIRCGSPCELDIVTSSPEAVAKALKDEQIAWAKGLRYKFLGKVDTTLDDFNPATFFAEMGYEKEIVDDVTELFKMLSVDSVTSKLSPVSRLFEEAFRGISTTLGVRADAMDNAIRSYMSIERSEIFNKLKKVSMKDTDINLTYLTKGAIAEAKLVTKGDLLKLESDGIHVLKSIGSSKYLVIDFKRIELPNEPHGKWAYTTFKEVSTTLNDLVKKHAYIANLNDSDLIGAEIRILNDFDLTKFISQKATRSSTQAFAEASLALDNGYDYLVDPAIIRIVRGVESRLEKKAAELISVEQVAKDFIEAKVKVRPSSPTVPTRVPGVVKTTKLNKAVYDELDGIGSDPNLSNILDDIHDLGIKFGDVEDLATRISSEVNIGIRQPFGLDNTSAVALSKDGSFKNQYQLGKRPTSSGLVSPGKGHERDEWEDMAFGGIYQSNPKYQKLADDDFFPLDVANERPIYGYLFSSDEVSGASDYGNVIFELDPSVKKVATLTNRDTSAANRNMLDTYGEVGTFKNPAPLVSRIYEYISEHPELSGKEWMAKFKKMETSEILHELTSLSLFDDYIESQIHNSGPLDFSNVKKLWIDRTQILQKETYTLRAELLTVELQVKGISERYGIPWGYLGDVSEPVVVQTLDTNLVHPRIITSNTFYMGTPSPVKVIGDIREGHRGYFMTNDIAVAKTYTNGTDNIVELRPKDGIKIFDHTDPKMVDELVDEIMLKFPERNEQWTRDSIGRGNWAFFEKQQITYILEDLGYAGNTQTESGSDIVIRMFKKKDFEIITPPATPEIPDGLITDIKERKIDSNYVVTTPTKKIVVDLPPANKIDGDVLLDASGDPLVVYHGTGVDIDKFDTSKTGASWFSDSPEYAGEYASAASGSPKIYPAYLNLNNPADLGFRDSKTLVKLDDVISRTQTAVLDAYENKMITKEVAKEISSSLQFIPKNDQFKEVWEWVQDEKIVIDSLKRSGYDGITAREGLRGEYKTYGVFNADQIKSVFASKGAVVDLGPPVKFVPDSAAAKHVAKSMDNESSEVFGAIQPPIETLQTAFHQTGPEAASAIIDGNFKSLNLISRKAGSEVYENDGADWVYFGANKEASQLAAVSDGIVFEVDLSSMIDKTAYFPEMENGLLMVYKKASRFTIRNVTALNDTPEALAVVAKWENELKPTLVKAGKLNVVPERVTSLDYFSDASLKDFNKLIFKDRSIRTEVPIEFFLSMAEEGKDTIKTERVAELIKKGTKFDDLPILQFNDKGQIVGHEGRHRARALQEAGYTTMPVDVRSSTIRWSEQSYPESFDYVEKWPTKITSQDGKTTVTFPFTRKGLYDDTIVEKLPEVYVPSWKEHNKLPDVVPLTTNNAKALNITHTAGEITLPKNMLSDLKKWNVDMDKFDQVVAKLKDDSTVGIRVSIDRDETFTNILGSGKLQNIYQYDPSATHALKGYGRDAWEQLLTNDSYSSSVNYKRLSHGDPFPPKVANERPIYGFLFAGNKTESAADYGEVIFEFGDDVKRVSSLTRDDSSFLKAASLGEFGEVGTFGNPTPVSQRLYEMLEAHKTKSNKYLDSLLDMDSQDILNELLFEQAYIEAQVHSSGALDLSKATKIWVDRDALLALNIDPSTAAAELARVVGRAEQLSARLGVPWGYLGETAQHVSVDYVPTWKRPVKLVSTPEQKEIVNSLNDFVSTMPSDYGKFFTDEGISIDSLDSFIDSIMTTSVPGVRISLTGKDDAFWKSLKSEGQLKNQFQVVSGGKVDFDDYDFPVKGSERDEWEGILSKNLYTSGKAYDDIPQGELLTKELADERPIYGFLFTKEETSSARDYGPVIVEYGDDIKPISTLTFDDSSQVADPFKYYGEGGTWENPAALKGKIREYLGYWAGEGNWKGTFDELASMTPQEALEELVRGEYVEIQVHNKGGLNISNATKLWIDKDAYTDNLAAVVKQVEELSELYGIPWGYLGETAQHVPGTLKVKSKTKKKIKL